MNATQKLWAADPHQYGPGKIHIVDDEDGSRTFCGKILSAMPGKPTTATKATCRICLNAVPNREQQKLWRANAEKQQAEREADRVAQNERWWAWYNAYLSSEAWRDRRRKVLSRANGRCEGCLDRTATQVHHTTYAHVGNEPLWELRAICDTCHEALHEKREARP